MTSKHRVLAALNHQKTDRVPIDYLANPGIDTRLKQHFGLSIDDHAGLQQKLGVDFRNVTPGYIGPKLHADVGETKVDEWGIHRRWIEHASGGYWDYCDWPLQHATLEDVHNWPLPSPDHFDYESVKTNARRLKDFYLLLGHPGVGDNINATSMLRTMEQVMLDLATDDEIGLTLMDRRKEIWLKVMERSIEAARSVGGIDMLWVGEDLGTQRGPMISVDTFRKHIRPRLQAFVNLAKAYDLPCMIHSCGSSSWAFDDFLDMGIEAVDTLQPEAANMSPQYLKSKWGDKLFFHGGISTAGPVAYGSVDDVIKDVNEKLSIWAKNGGYACAPTHCLQDNSPTENVLAMYETARSFT